MKKILLLIALLMLALSCTESDRIAWENVQRKKRERGYGCYTDDSGYSECGYLTPPRDGY